MSDSLCKFYSIMKLKGKRMVEAEGKDERDEAKEREREGGEEGRRNWINESKRLV